MDNYIIEVNTDAKTGITTETKRLMTPAEIEERNQTYIALNKQNAKDLLLQTDWTTIADVGNPQMSNPYLANQAEFINYRNQVRQYAVYPQPGNIDWPTVPVENWVKV